MDGYRLIVRFADGRWAVAQLKMLGNGIVPAQMALALRLLLGEAVDDGFIYQPVCTACRWEGQPTANDQLARARAREHKVGEK